jgi:hypothetical protein
MTRSRVTRSLSGKQRGGAELWQVTKRFVRQIQSDDGVLIVDDTISEKPYSDENDIVCWHYDHTSGEVIKGINLMTALYYVPSRGLSLPVEFHLIAKTEQYVDKKSGKTKRRSPITKNEYYRMMLQQAVINQIPFKYVLNDVWFAAADNMNFVKHKLKKEFVMPLKTNRKVALSADDKRHGIYVRVDEVVIEPNTVRPVYLEDVSFPLLLAKQVFANKDGSTGVLFLVTSDTTLTYDGITSLYQKRWTIAERPSGEPFHKSLKQNAALERSPAHTVTTQTNHIFASLCAFIKLEMLKRKSKLNHFALKAHLYLHAVQSAFDALRQCQPTPISLPA